MIDRRLLGRTHTERLAFISTAALSLAAAGTTIGQAWSLSRAIDLAFLRGQSLSAVTGPLIAFVLCSLLRAVLYFAIDLVTGELALRVKSELRHALLGHLLNLGPAFTQAQRSGELTAAAVDGIEALDAYFRQYLPQILISAVIPICLLLVLAPTDPLSALVLALTAPLLPLFMALIGRATEALTRRQYGLLSLLSAHFLDVLQGLTTLKLLGQSRAQAETIRRVGERYRSATMDVLRVAFLSALTLELIATLSTAIVAVEVGLRLLHGRMAFQPAMFVLILAPEFYMPFRTLGTRFHAGVTGSAAAKRIFSILDLPPSAPGRPGGVLPERPRAGSPPSISLRDVHYAYDGSRHALRGLSLDIPAGARIALVGPSGAGKSTLAYLLLRFLEPTAGEIRADGIDLQEWPADAWRSRLAWVPQSPHLFPMSVSDNLRLARPQASEAELLAAMQLAQLDDWLVGLPHGLDTLVGERAARLSAGQAQRLALARAFLRDAPFLLLDEPTSKVDPELETRLQSASERLMQGRTVLVIAHRLSTVYQADEIVVMHNGRVVERGQHAALWQAGGMYRQMLSAYAGSE